MSRLLCIRKVYNTLILLGLFASIFALLRYPSESIQAAAEGLTLSLNVIIPSLFPFFVLSTLLIRLGIASQFGRVFEPIMRPLFRVSGVSAAAFVLGFIGGYPIGAKTAIGLYEDRQISKVEAERLLAFSNNSGPAFILGVIGVGIFASSRIGLLLYLAHAIASILVGILFRFWGYNKPIGVEKKKRKTEVPPSFSTAFVKSVSGAFQSTLNICAFIIFFTVIIRLLFLAGAIPAFSGFLGAFLAGFGLDAYWASVLLTGFIELSSGVWSLRDMAGQLSQSIAMAAFMLGWAGLSVHCQVLSFIGDSGLSVRSYILGKTLHAVFSAVLVFFLVRVFPFEVPVSLTLAEGVSAIVSMDFSTTILISSATAGIVALFILLICLFSPKNTRQAEKKMVR